MLAACGANDRIRMTVVILVERVGPGHFAEMRWEANRRDQLRLFEIRDLAERWLVEN